MQCGRNLIELDCLHQCGLNRINDASGRHIPKRRAIPSTVLRGSTMMSNSLFGRRQRAYETKRRINNEETIAEFIAAGREVKRIVIYHDFLPTPRSGSHVKSDKTHTQSSRYTP